MGSGKRLAYYIEKQGFTKKEFCNKFSLSYNSFVQILIEKRPLGINILDKLHFALPKLNLHWLLYGEGTEEINVNDIFDLKKQDESNILGGDIFEFLLIKYMNTETIKNKIKAIIHEKQL